MNRWPHLFRLVALGLMLLAGFEVLACDLVSPEFCKVSTKTNGDTPGPASDGRDNCLCCCTHYVAPSEIRLVELMMVGVAPSVMPAFSPLPEPSRILHPPRV